MKLRALIGAGAMLLVTPAFADTKQVPQKEDQIILYEEMETIFHDPKDPDSKSKEQQKFEPKANEQIILYEEMETI